MKLVTNIELTQEEIDILFNLATGACFASYASIEDQTAALVLLKHLLQNYLRKASMMLMQLVQ